MVSIKRLILGSVALLGLAGTANAAFVPASWTQDIGGTTYIGAGQSYTYSHDLTTKGFTPLSDIITNFSLAIDLYDDKRDGFFDQLEIADVDISGVHDGYVSSFQFGNDAFSSGLTLVGLIELNLAGTLTVTVSSVCNILVCGDFNLGTSSLTARGYSQVPEPGTMALLGLGLLGVGLGRRKKLAQ